MRRRVYLLRYVCSRGPFPPAPLQHPFLPPICPSPASQWPALPASRPPRGLPGWSAGREPRPSLAAVKAAMARVVGCRCCARAGLIGYGSLIRTSPLPSTIPPALYGFASLPSFLWGGLDPTAAVFAGGRSYPHDPSSSSSEKCRVRLPCGWRGRAFCC